MKTSNLKTTIIKYLILVLAVSFYSGCASKRVVMPVKSLNYEISHDAGNPVLTSEKKNSVAVKLLNTKLGKNQTPAFLVLVGNRDNESFVIDMTNIKAYEAENPLMVLTYEKRKKEIQNAQALQMFSAALGGVSASLQAASPNYASINGYNFSYYDSQQSAMAQSLVNLDTTAKLENIAASAEVQLNSIEGILRKTTVNPGEIRGGMVSLRAKKKIKYPTELKLLVEIQNETHEFIFAMQKPNNK